MPAGGRSIPAAHDLSKQLCLLHQALPYGAGCSGNWSSHLVGMTGTHMSGLRRFLYGPEAGIVLTITSGYYRRRDDGSPRQ